MATTKHKAYSTTITTSLSTALDALANAANSVASAAINNSTSLDLYHDLTLNVATQGTARSAGATVAVFITPALDGSTYDTVNHGTAELAAVFSMDASTAARQVTRRDVPVPPGLFKYFVRNATGQAFAASGNLLEYRPHSIETA